MFKNYLKNAWRNLLRDKQFSLLNLLGLSTGLACVLLIYLWVTDELVVDKFNANDKQLFQVMKNSPNAGGGISTFEWLPALLPQALHQEMPEIESAVAVVPYKDGSKKGIISFRDQYIKAADLYAGKDFFNIFSFPLLEGNANQVFIDKYGVVISEELASKLFHTTNNIIGTSIDWNQPPLNGTYHVSGIFKKVPSNYTLQCDVIFSFELYKERKPQIQEWTYNDPCTYVLLKKGTNIKQFDEKISGFLKNKSKEDVSLFIRPFSDQYLYGKYENGVQIGGRIEYVRLFSIIALFILLIACINFMNLSTAKAARRIKEVGIKKVIGASRRSLIFQYIGESMLMSFVSLIIALLIAALLLPAFKELTGKEINIQLDTNIIVSVISIAFITGLIAGGYPALYLSSFKPISILKGKLNTSFGESRIRKGLVVFQFSISVILIVSVLIVYQQMELIQTISLGYNKDNIICFKKEGRLTKDYETFLYEAKKISGVLNATTTWGNMTNADTYTSDLTWQGKNANDKIEFASLQTNYDFIKTLGINLKQGRDFSKNFNTDDKKIIFNEAAIDAMELKDPIGKTIRLWGEDREIIGVVRNFHFESLYQDIKPCFLMLLPIADNVMIKIKAGTEKETIAQLQKLYNEFDQGLAFDYKFLDDDYQALYLSEQRVAVLSKYFAGIAILISCLGLFGLAAFTAQKRQKEIGIRKVIGASVSNVVAMLSKDFLILVSFSLLIAVPLSWWLMHTWLQSFAYRINISPLVFLIAGVSVVLITLITISFQSVKAAIANPVKSLRTE